MRMVTFDDVSLVADENSLAISSKLKASTNNFFASN